MDLTLTTQQQQIVDAVRTLLARHDAPARAKALLASDGYDHDLDARLDEAGFTGIVGGDGTGPVEAGLVALEVAKAAGASAYAAGEIVAGKLLGANPKVPVALTRRPADFPFRFGRHARLMLIDAGDEAQALDLADGDVQAVDTDQVGWPMGRLAPGVLARAKGLGPGTGDALRRWWRLALAFETVGAMQGALDLTVQYVKDRVQFGRPIGEFQTLQHRLAELLVVVEGARWIALEAAFRDASPLNAAVAAGRAASAATLVARECHQMHGAIGLTREYPLHLWSTRLGPLGVELGGPLAHRREAARLRFSPGEISAREAYWR